MTIEEKIRANAEMVVAQLKESSGIEDFGYDAASVAYLDGFIERQRASKEWTEAEAHRICDNLGCYLGECVRTCYGGEWSHFQGSWAIVFNERNATFPFNKVRKHFENGASDSVASWFNEIPLFFAKVINPPPTKKKPWWKRQ